MKLISEMPNNYLVNFYHYNENGESFLDAMLNAYRKSMNSSLEVS